MSKRYFLASTFLRCGSVGAVLTLVSAVSAAETVSKFEVAAVKPCARPLLPAQKELNRLILDETPLGSIPGSPNSHRVAIKGLSTLDVISIAYRIRAHQVAGPNWISDECFEINALIPSDADPRRANEMLQALLVDRFGMKSHAEPREVNGYALSVVSKDFHLLPTSPSSATPLPLHGDSEAASKVKKRFEAKTEPSLVIQYRQLSMARLADALSFEVGSPVADMTGLSGEYSLVLDLSSSAETGSLNRESLLIASLKKLGLQLVRKKITINMRVIDAISRLPVEN